MERLLNTLDRETLDTLMRAERSPKSRGWLIRRLLLAADATGLLLGFLIGVLATGENWSHAGVQTALFAASLPLWLAAAKLLRLYDKDEARADHSTVDDLVGIWLLLASGGLVLALAMGYTASASVSVLVFCACATVLIALGRTTARAIARRTHSYVQPTVIVGAGDVGQLVARKLRQHPEYGLQLLGFVDRNPKPRRADLDDLQLLGTPEELPQIARLLGVRRVIVAFSQDASMETLALVRSLRNSAVQVDIVPRLFEVIGTNTHVELLEGLPVVGLHPIRVGPSSRIVKRVIDIVGATILLALTAPIFVIIAWRINRESPGPVFFRQRRLGMNQREFTLMKFRTMHVGVDEGPHREYIEASMKGPIEPSSNGLFKLDRGDAVTSVGRWLRRTSLDELPQLLNVLKGDMSLVGPRPCLAYEVEHFAPHHFDRFLVPAGITGLWQVAGRAHTNFSEALDIDVLYARSWSPGLDLSLLLRTPGQMFRTAGTT